MIKKFVKRYINLKNFDNFKNEIKKFDINEFQKKSKEYIESKNNITNENYINVLKKELNKEDIEFCNEYFTYLKNFSNIELDYFLFLLEVKGLEKYHPSIIYSEGLNENLNNNLIDEYIKNENEINNKWKEININEVNLNTNKQNDANKEDKKETVKEEKKNFDIELTSFIKEKKLSLIKEIKNVFGLNLKDSKDLVEKSPTILKKKVNKEEAEKLKESLMKIGCEISLK